MTLKQKYIYKDFSLENTQTENWLNSKAGIQMNPMICCHSNSSKTLKLNFLHEVWQKGLLFIQFQSWKETPTTNEWWWLNCIWNYASGVRWFMLMFLKHTVNHLFPKPLKLFQVNVVLLKQTMTVRENVQPRCEHLRLKSNPFFFLSLSLYNQNHQERRHCFSFSNLTICCFLWSHCECQKIWAFFSQKIKKYVTDYTVAWPWVDESAGLLKGGLMPVITERKKTWYLLDMRMKSICGVAHL